MIKKLLGFIFVFTLCMSAFASEFKQLPYDDIKDGDKIKQTETQGWTDKVKHKDLEVYVKLGSKLYQGLNVTDSNENIFDTECDYIFINNDKLYGYSEKDLKFYDISKTDDNFIKNELTTEEVAALFKDFRIIMISDFSTTTNVYRFKKGRGEEKIMLLSDKDIDFSDYTFTTNKAKFNQYNTSNAIGITKTGLIQFSKYGENTQDLPWFILLVR